MSIFKRSAKPAETPEQWGKRLLEEVSRIKGKCDEQKALTLINRGADIHLTDKHGITALMQASGQGHADIVSILMNKGADVNTTSLYGDSALNWAAHGGHLTIVKMLLDHHAKIGTRNRDGSTALIIAAGRGHTEIVKTLIENGASIEEDAFTARYVALQQQRADTAKFLDEEIERNRARRLARPEVTPSETWVLADTNSLGHIGTYPGIQKKLTTIFNFKSRERLIISEGLNEPAAAAITPPCSFDDMPLAKIKDAFKKFRELGGNSVEEDFALYGDKKRLDKSAPIKPTQTEF